MAPGFSFPPPPPPPPKSVSNEGYSGTDRGGYGDGGTGRGRGGTRGRGAGHDSGAGYSSYAQPAQSDATNGHTSAHQRGQKRKLDDRAGSWRGAHSQSHGPRPHPMKHTGPKPKSAVAPAVPSFGTPMVFTKGPQPSSTATAHSQPLPAPFADSDSGSDADPEEDEEAAFAHASVPLKFEHEGEIITLATAADVEAWASARRSNFPTSERARLRAQERQARVDERRRIECETAVAMGFAPAPRTEQKQSVPEKQEPEEAAPSAALGLAGYASSESDEDAGPEVQSSKTPVAPLQPRPQAQPRAQLPCKYYSQSGRCKQGARCTFAHIGPPAKDERGGGRKTLYQRLVEQERGAENRLAVLAVRYLGDKGFFKPKE